MIHRLLGRSQFCRVDAVIHVLGCRGLLLGPLLLSPLTIDLRSFIRFGNQVLSSNLNPGVKVRVVTNGMLSVRDGLALSILFHGIFWQVFKRSDNRWLREK